MKGVCQATRPVAGCHSLARSPAGCSVFHSFATRPSEGGNSLLVGLRTWQVRGEFMQRDHSLRSAARLTYFQSLDGACQHMILQQARQAHCKGSRGRWFSSLAACCGSQLQQSINALPRSVIASSTFFPWRPFAARGSAIRAAKKGSKEPAAVEEGTGLRRGVMLEFEKEGSSQKRAILAVLQKPDGKKNWFAMDQHGDQYSVKPQNITFIVPPKPTKATYTASDIVPFLEEVEALAGDSSLLELAWDTLTEEDRGVDATEMAELLFGGTTAAECYGAHRLLTMDRVYFKQRKVKGDYSDDGVLKLLHEPRPVGTVQQLQRAIAAEEEKKAQLLGYVNRLLAAADAPRKEKPRPEDWDADEYSSIRTSALKEFALEKAVDNQKRLAEEVLEALQHPKSPNMVFEFLVKVGIWPQHTNLELLKSSFRTDFPKEVLEEALQRQAQPPEDRAASSRVDLTHLKVYAIDSIDTKEVDDGLSAESLPDGRIRVWVHVADPTRFMEPGDVIDVEAKLRGTSTYLPTGVTTMIPTPLAYGPMSLRQGEVCCAMSVGVTLNEDGSIEELEIVPSTVQVTYQLTYDEVDSLLSDGLALEHEPEIKQLMDIALLRHQYRMSMNAVEINMPEMDIKVKELESDNPVVKISVLDPGAPSRRLVSECMVLAGEAVAEFGRDISLPLPYRGQEEPRLPSDEELAAIPEGPCRAVALRKCMTRSETNCSAPLEHASLGLAGYVQFSSPIRRYGDLLTHYQVKAALRGEQPPFSVTELDKLMSYVSAQSRESSALERKANMYWVLEWFRQQPRGATYPAIVLRWIKEEEGIASVLVEEIGMELSARFARSVRIGSQVDVRVALVDVRRGTLKLVEAESFTSFNLEDLLRAEDQSSRSEEAGTSGSEEASSGGEEAGSWSQNLGAASNGGLRIEGSSEEGNAESSREEPEVALLETG